MPTLVSEPDVLVNTVLIPAVAGQRIVVMAMYVSQAGGIGYFASTVDLAVAAGPRIDAAGGATQIAYALQQGVFALPVGEGLTYDNRYSAGSIKSNVVLLYRTEQE